MRTMEKALAKWPKSFTWLFVMLFIAIAVVIRFWQNTSANYLLVGGDGPYYPLQVRSMFEQFKLALPDAPLLFIIEALMAKVLYLFHYSSQNECILMAVKLTDSLLPPLAAIPVFLIARELKSGGNKTQLFNTIIICYSIINLTTVTVFPSGLQKNAFAIVWVFSCMYFLIKYIKNRQKKDVYYIIGIVFLCALTHFGSLSIILFLIAVLGITWLCYNPGYFKQLTLKRLLIAAGIILVLITIIGLYDSARLLRLLKIPFKIVEYPVLLLLLHGDDVGAYFSPGHMIVTNLMAIIAFVIVFFNRKKLSKEDKLISAWLIISALLLSSPLIGLEWANRLYVLSYIPVTVLYLVIVNNSIARLPKLVSVAMFSLLIILSLLNVRASNSCISNEAYEEFTKLKTKVDFTKKTVVIGRQDLRLLAGWEFRTKSASEYLFTKEDFKNYDHVYVIRQIKGSNFSPTRFRGDALVPVNSVKLYAGNCFDLYQLKSSEGWEGGKGKPAGVRGKITDHHENSIAIRNDKTGSIKIVELDSHVLITLKHGNRKIENGIYVEVYGKRKAFSLHFIAESVNEIDGDKETKGLSR